MSKFVFLIAPLPSPIRTAFSLHLIGSYNCKTQKISVSPEFSQKIQWRIQKIQWSFGKTEKIQWSFEFLQQEGSSGKIQSLFNLQEYFWIFLRKSPHICSFSTKKVLFVPADGSGFQRWLTKEWEWTVSGKRLQLFSSKPFFFVVAACQWKHQQRIYFALHLRFVCIALVLRGVWPLNWQMLPTRASQNFCCQFRSPLCTTFRQKLMPWQTAKIVQNLVRTNFLLYTCEDKLNVYFCDR